MKGESDMAQHSTHVRVVRTDRSGHFQGEQLISQFATFAWQPRREVVVVNTVQVDSYEEFCRAVADAPDAFPEVCIFPPLAGGV
jgi:hypothetical protein